MLLIIIEIVIKGLCVILYTINKTTQKYLQEFQEHKNEYV